MTPLTEGHVQAITNGIQGDPDGDVCIRIWKHRGNPPLGWQLSVNGTNVLSCDDRRDVVMALSVAAATIKWRSCH